MELLPSCPGAFLASVLLVLLSEARGDCGPPKAFRYAMIRQDSKQSYPVGTRLTYSCIRGYELTSGTRPVTECLGTSEWSEVSVSCRGRRCPIPDIENGRIVEDSELRLGDKITFACNEGYRPVGQRKARCVLNNNRVDWDSVPPHCERIPCLPPPEIANGVHNGQDNYAFASAVTYKCNSPFSLIGVKTIVCIFDQDLNGMWSASAPECKVGHTEAPELPTDGPDGTLLPSSGPNVTSVFGSQAPPVTIPTYTSALPTLQTELAWEKLFMILQEIKDIVNIKTNLFEERLDGLEKKVDKVMYELDLLPTCQRKVGGGR